MVLSCGKNGRHDIISTRALSWAESGGEEDIDMDRNLRHNLAEKYMDKSTREWPMITNRDKEKWRNVVETSSLTHA